MSNHISLFTYKGATYTNFHLEELNRHCRVCGSKLKDRNVYKCQNERYRERLAFLGVDCTNDVQHVHPRYFCNRCYRAAPRQHTSPGSTPITPYLWKEHTESGCQVSSYTLIQENAQVCQHFRSLQRPGRKPSAKRGRPPASGKKMLANHVHKLMQSVQRNTTYKTALFLKRVSCVVFVMQYCTSQSSWAVELWCAQIAQYHG